jgi:uncharacterized protein (TIGR03067 family)
MRHLNRRLVVLLAAVLSVAFVPLPRPKARSTVERELKGLGGEWEYVSVTQDGVRVDVSPGQSELFKGDQLSLLSGGEVTIRWTVAVDPSKKPKAMDLRGVPGVTVLCAYALSGDTLTVAYGDRKAVKGRPADLKPRKGIWVQVLKRKKRP